MIEGDMWRKISDNGWEGNKATERVCGKTK